MLRWAQCGFHKKRIRTCYAELLLLHLVRSESHVVYYGVSKLRKLHTIFHACVGLEQIQQKMS
jgi:hypothetical protein